MTAILSAEENRTPALERELLWTYRALYEFKGNLSFHCTRSSKYQARQLLHRLARASHPDSEYWEDLTPHDSILWIREKVDAEMLTRLSFRIGPHRDGGKTVAAVRSEYMKRFWEPKRFARPLEDHDIDEDEWRKLEDNTDELLHFDINGPEGERIVEVGVDSSTKPRALLVSFVLFRLMYTKCTNKLFLRFEQTKTGVSKLVIQILRIGYVTYRVMEK